MGQQLNAPVTTYNGTNLNLSQLLSFVSQGYKVLVGIHLDDIAAYQNTGNHMQVLLGDTYIGGKHYAEVTNGWNIESNQNQIWGSDPRNPYPITLIDYDQFNQAWQDNGHQYAAVGP